jgi:hypothetical protein
LQKYVAGELISKAQEKLTARHQPISDVFILPFAYGFANENSALPNFDVCLIINFLRADMFIWFHVYT